MPPDDLAGVVRAAARDWVWVPPDAQDITTYEYRLTHYPWGRSSVQWSRSSRPFAELLGEVEARVRDAGHGELRWWVHEDTLPPATDTLLERAGFALDETVDVLALDLREGAGPVVARLDVPGDVEARPADDLAALADAEAVAAAVFDWAPPSPAQREHAAEAARRGLTTGRWTERQYVAVLAGVVVGHAGVTLAPGGPDGGRVARLWGGGVLPQARGRGAYRALLAARCAFAVEQGATLALVKGRVATSAPILRRAGFDAYGQERCYGRRLDVPSG